MEQDYAEVLAFSNAVRARLGRQPLDRLRKGKHPKKTNLDTSVNCVIARTVNYGCRNVVEIGNYMIWNTDDEVIAKIPDPIADFIVAFDCGDLPELIGEGWAA